MLARVSRAAWRLERGRAGTDVGAGVGPRRGDLDPTLATAVGLSPSRVHQLVAGADLDALDAALGELRAGRPRGSRCGGTIADRLSDEVDWLRQCADWLVHLDASSYPPTGRTGPSWPT